jgi:hypothetical protein
MNETVGISGVGLIGPWGTDLSSLRTIRRPTPGSVNLVDTVPPVEGVAKNDMRRMSKLTRFSLFAAQRAMAAANCCANRTGLFVGLTHGPTTHMVGFHDFLFDYGPDMASPNSFSNGVTNAPLSSISALLKMTYGGTTILGYENNGCNVLSYCARAIIASHYEACLAGSSEEYAPVVHDAYKACGWLGSAAPGHLPWPHPGQGAGLGVSEGSAFFVLEPLSKFTDRKPLCLFAPVDLDEYRGGADAVISCASAGPHDGYELAALHRIAAAGGAKPALLFAKPLFGETFGLGAMLSGLVACDMVANGARYPAFPIHPEIAPLFEPQTKGPASSVLVVAAGRNGQVSAGLFSAPERFGAS